MRIAGEQGRANSHTFNSKLSRHDLRRIETLLKCTLARLSDNGFQQEIAGLHNGAAQYYSLQTQQINHAGDRDSDRPAGTLKHHYRKVITIVCLKRQIASRET